MQSVSGMAGDTLLHDSPERRECGPDIVAYARGLSIDREAAGCTVHLGSDLLHPFWHEWSNLCCAMQLQQLIPNRCSAIRPAVSKSLFDSAMLICCKASK